MGGTEAPDHLAEGYRTQVWLALSDDPAERVTGESFCHQKRVAPGPGARYSRAGPFAIGMQKNLRDTCYVIGHFYSK